MPGLKTKKGRGDGRVPWISNRNARSRAVILQISFFSRDVHGVHLAAPLEVTDSFFFLFSFFFFRCPITGSRKIRSYLRPLKITLPWPFFCLFSDCSHACDAQRGKQGQVGGEKLETGSESEAEKERRLLDFSSRERARRSKKIH